MADIGRPSKYKKAFCQQLLTHMGEGLSFESFASEIGVHRDTLYEWAKQYPDFSDAKKRGTDLALKWWERIGQAGMVGKIKGFNAAVWIFSMKNRFKWSDRLAVDDESEKPQRTFTLKYTLPNPSDKEPKEE